MIFLLNLVQSKTILIKWQRWLDFVSGHLSERKSDYTMKIYNFEVTEIIDVSEIEYQNFVNELDEKGLLKKYLGRVYSKAIELHKASLPEWKYGSPQFVRMNENGLVSIFYETFDEFFYMIKQDGTVGWCRKNECKEAFPEYFEMLREKGLEDSFRKKSDKPFKYFQ